MGSCKSLLEIQKGYNKGLKKSNINNNDNNNDNNNTQNNNNKTLYLVVGCVCQQVCVPSRGPLHVTLLPEHVIREQQCLRLVHYKVKGGGVKEGMRCVGEKGRTEGSEMRSGEMRGRGTSKSS